jgi:hypothetical protein
VGSAASTVMDAAEPSAEADFDGGAGRGAIDGKLPPPRPPRGPPHRVGAAPKGLELGAQVHGGGRRRGVPAGGASVRPA